MWYFRTAIVPVLPNWSRLGSSVVHWSVELLDCALLTRSHQRRCPSRYTSRMFVAV